MDLPKLVTVSAVEFCDETGNSACLELSCVLHGTFFHSTADVDVIDLVALSFDHIGESDHNPDLVKAHRKKSINELLTSSSNDLHLDV